MALEATDLFVVQRQTGLTPLLKTTASQMNAFFEQTLDEVTTVGNTTSNSIIVGKVGVNTSGIPAYDLEVTGTSYFANSSNLDQISIGDLTQNKITGFSFIGGVLEQTGTDTTTTKLNSDIELANGKKFISDVELAAGKKFKGDGSELTNLPIGDGVITFTASQNINVTGSFSTNQSGNTTISLTGPNLTSFLQKPGSEGTYLINEAADGTITYTTSIPIEAIDGGVY